jgi:hypothetical protein
MGYQNRVSRLLDFSLAAHGELAQLVNHSFPAPISSPSRARVPIPPCATVPTPSRILAIYLLHSCPQNRRGSTFPSKIHHQITLPIDVRRAVCVHQCRLSVQAGAAESSCPRRCLSADLLLLAQGSWCSSVWWSSSWCRSSSLWFWWQTAAIFLHRRKCGQRRPTFLCYAVFS